MAEEAETNDKATMESIAQNILEVRENREYYLMCVCVCMKLESGKYIEYEDFIFFVIVYFYTRFIYLQQF